MTTHFTEAEESQLRALTDRAFDLRGKPGYEEAVADIERWFYGLKGQRLSVRIAGADAKRRAMSEEGTT